MATEDPWNSLEFQLQYILSKNEGIVYHNLIFQSFALNRIFSQQNVAILFYSQIVKLINFQDTMNRLQVLRQTITSTNPYQSYTKIIIQIKDKVATLWLNSPKDLNSLTVQMAKQIKSAIIQLDNDRSVKVIVIKSKHNKIFCAGGDIKSFKENDYSVYPYSLHFISIQQAFRSVTKPIVSIVEGKALGGGFQLALLSNIIVASKNASFGLPQITLGLIPGMGGTQLLSRIVGTKVAMKMILTGQPINAEEAQRLNIAYLIQPENYQANLNIFIKKLADKASENVQVGKSAVGMAVETTLNTGLDHEEILARTLLGKQCAIEGMIAFVQKRKPNFKDI